MPVVNIEGVGKVTFPDGMSAQQIQSAIERDILPKAKPPAAREPEYKTQPSAWERFGRGAADLTDRIAQGYANLTGPGALELTPSVARDTPSTVTKSPSLGDTLTANVNDELKRYEADRGPNAGVDAARVGGNIAAQAPLAASPAGRTTLGRTGAGIVTGGLGGLLQFDPTNSKGGTLLNTATGALAGAVLNPAVGAVADRAAPFLAAVSGRIRGAIEGLRGNASPQSILAAVPELQQLPPNVQRDLIAEAQSMVRRTGDLNAEQLGRRANLVANDVVPTRSMVTRDPADWTRERNLQKLAQSPDEQLAGLGQELTTVYQGNDVALTNRLQQIGGIRAQGSTESLGMDAMKGIERVADMTQADVSKLYEQVRAARGNDLASDARRLFTALEDLSDSTAADGIVGSVRRRLTKFGMIDKDGALTNNTLTVQQAEELRKFVNAQPWSFGKSQIIRAIDEDVLAGLGDDAFSGARSAAAQRFDLLGNPATQRALNTLGELQQGKTAQNFIQTQIINGAEQDVSSLLTVIGRLPAAEKQQATDALRTGVMRHLEAKAINPNSGQFSGAALNRALNEIGDAKLAAVLGTDALAQLKSLARASLDATYQPPYAAVNSSNTAPMLLSLMQRARSVPGVPLIVSEEAQKIAARSGYRTQLAEALDATPQGKLPAPNKKVEALARRLAAGTPPAANSAMQERRKKSN